MTERQQFLKDNYNRVIDNIENAKAKRKSSQEVHLLAATKTQNIEDVLFLVEECGLKLCGENRQNEFTEKHQAVQNAGAQMHFIGHLQTNKLKYIVGQAELIHSVDSLHLAQEISRRSVELGITSNILCELNAGAEESKTGIMPQDFESTIDEICALEGLNVSGIMVMAPRSTETEEIRKYFVKSYGIYLDFLKKKRHNIGEPVLSMGMSDSYVTAVEEGSTLVRVGSAIFGPRDYR